MTSAGPYEPEQVAALLESAVATIRAEVEALAKPLHVWHPAEGEWSINEIIGHLIEAERRGFAGRIKILLASKDPQLEGWDQNEVARGRRDDMKPAAKLVAELERMRAEIVKVVRGLAAADLKRGGSIPRSGGFAWRISSRSGCTTTGTTSSRSSPMCRRGPGRTWATRRSSRESEGGADSASRAAECAGKEQSHGRARCGRRVFQQRRS